jgi:Protein of unknown function (DUF3307)
MTEHAPTFAAVLPALLVAHQVADHWVQTPDQATRKGAAGWSGRLACALHVASYTATTAGVIGLLWAVLDLPISPVGFVAGQAVSAVSHYWADRRVTLARLAAWLGKTEFYGLGAPRAGREDNPTLGTGSYALDQAFHAAWLLVAALLTVVIA